MLHNPSKQFNLQPLSSGTRNGEYYITGMLVKHPIFHNQKQNLEISQENQFMKPILFIIDFCHF